MCKDRDGAGEDALEMWLEQNEQGGGIRGHVREEQ